MEEKLAFLAAIISSIGAGLFLGLGYFVVAFSFFVLAIGTLIFRDVLINISKPQKAVSA